MAMKGSLIVAFLAMAPGMTSVGGIFQISQWVKTAEDASGSSTITARDVALSP